MTYRISILLLLLNTLACGQVIGGTGSVAGTGSIQLANTPRVATSSLTNGLQGVAYSATLMETGGTGPFTWSISNGNLPAGLSLSTAGVISGTPTTVETQAFTVVVTDANSLFDQATLSLAINPSAALTLQSATLPSGEVGAAFGPVVLQATGGATPYVSCSFSAGTPPTGLNIAVTNTVPKGCTLNGTITASAATYTFTAKITDNIAATATQSYSITVFNPSSGPTAVWPQTWPNTIAYKSIPVDQFKTVKAAGGSYSNVQSALTAWCAAPDEEWDVTVDAGFDNNLGASPWVWCAKYVAGTSDHMPTKFIIFHSSTPPTANRTICSGGTALAFSRNPGCTNDIAKLWKLHTSNIDNTNGALINLSVDAAGNGPNHIIIMHAEIYPDAGTHNQTQSLLGLDNKSATQHINQPHYIGFEQNYIHSNFGDDGDPGGTAHGLINVFKWGAGLSWMKWNYVDQVAIYNTQGHIIGGLDAEPGNLFKGNWLEGEGACCFFGGGSPQVPGLVPTDEIFLQNRITKNPAWMPISHTLKLGDINSFEIKNGHRILLSGNIHENNVIDVQNGQTLTVDTRACSVACDNYTAGTEDIIVDREIMRRSGDGIMFSGRSGAGNAGPAATTGQRRVLLQNVLIYGIGVYAGNTPYFGVRTGSVSHTWTGTAVRDATGQFVTLTLADGGTGYHQTDTRVNDPIDVSGCSDSSFNTPTNVRGPLALSGTDPNGLVVVYPSVGTPNATATGCVYDYHEGFPWGWTAKHITVIGNTTNSSFYAPSTTGNAGTPDFPMYRTYRDSIFAGTGTYAGAIFNSGAEGSSLSQGVDTTTLTFEHLVFPGRWTKAGSYQEWHNGTFVGAGNAPGSTLSFPANIPCSGATADATCIGFKGMMNGAAFLNDTDTPLTDYALDPTSIYAAGGAQQASDGTNMGADMNAISAAQTESMYSGCSTNPAATNYCGPTGPFPDF